MQEGGEKVLRGKHHGGVEMRGSKERLRVKTEQEEKEVIHNQQFSVRLSGKPPCCREVIKVSLVSVSLSVCQDPLLTLLPK